MIRKSIVSHRFGADVIITRIIEIGEADAITTITKTIETGEADAITTKTIEIKDVAFRT